MNSPDAGRLRWVWWAFFFVFLAMGLAVRWKFLPRNHWSDPFWCILPMLLAQFCSTWILRRIGVSQESRHVEIWRKQQTIQVPADFCLELRHPHWQLWIVPPLGLLSVVAMLSIYFLVPASQQINREWWLPLIGFFSLVTWYSWFYLSRPIIRLDSRGISGAFIRLTTWDKLTACRYEEKKAATGDVMHHQITVLNSIDQSPTIFSLSEVSFDERLQFCQSLRRVLGASND